MKHQFYHYRAHAVNEDFDASDLAAIEAAQEHAHGVFARKVDAFPPPLPDDPALARVCLLEWRAVLDDLSCAAMTTGDADREKSAKAIQADPCRSNRIARIAFRVRQGTLALAAGYPWSAQAAPVFRSQSEPRAGTMVLYSDIVALDEAYALLELRASDEELRLNISGGGKNPSNLYISLYTNGRLMEKSLLGAEVSWDLSDSEPGLYQLDCGDKPALSFQIQE